MATFQKVRTISGVKDVTIFGRTLHVVLPKTVAVEQLKNASGVIRSHTFRVIVAN